MTTQTITRTEMIKVFVCGVDAPSQAGVCAYLRGRPEIQLVPYAELAAADVALVSVDTVDEPALSLVRAVRRGRRPGVLLLVKHVDQGSAGAAVQAGALGIVRRSAITREWLLRVIRAAAAGDGVLPPDLLGGVLRQVHASVHHRGEAARSRPSDREVHVLRMLSEGCDTREIARELAYSERTVKNVIQDVTRRFGLRNRSHAVAYAVRHGII